MKKVKLTVIALMLMATQFAVAKDIKIVIKGTSESPLLKTEVFTGGKFKNDTITVLPAEDITEIQLSIKTFTGEVIFSDLIPFEVPETYHFITPPMPEGFQLEIKDNNGVVYTGIEEEE